MRQHTYDWKVNPNKVGVIRFHIMSIQCTPRECPFMSRIHETDSCLEFV